MTLSSTVVIFGLFVVIPIIIDRATGGRIKGEGDMLPTYGTYTPDLLFPIFMISGTGYGLRVKLMQGVFYGMIDLIRRVIRRDIVGGDMQKLKQFDTLVTNIPFSLILVSCSL